MNSVSVRGREGAVRWGYHLAATLGTWTLTRTDDKPATLTAEVVSSDAFKVSQQPLTFTVPRPNGKTWRWPIVMLQISGGELTASLGPQE